MSNYRERMDTRYKMEKLYEWDKWRVEIPYLKFKPEWEVKVIPPVTGAVVRFLVKKGESIISTYLDCYGELGCFGEPYWEIYPYVNGDVYRCAMNETESLIDAIEQSLNAGVSL